MLCIRLVMRCSRSVDIGLVVGVLLYGFACRRLCVLAVVLQVMCVVLVVIELFEVLKVDSTLR